MEPKEASIFHWLYSYHLLPNWVPEVAPHSFVVILLLTILSVLATRNVANVPSGIQNFMEWAVEGLENFTLDAIGPDGRRYTPFIGAFFLYILTMNLVGLIPGMKSPTTNLNTTVALGLSAIVAVHYYAIRAVGIKAWLSHFMGDPLWLAPLLIPLHIIGELARPLSLSLRLYGNIFGEDMVIAILAGFSPILLRIAGVPVLALPTQLPMLIFSLLTDVLQAIVFCMLVSIYIATTIGEHDHSPGHEHDEHEDGYDLLMDAVPV